MKSMNFMPIMGLRKDQQGPSEFIELNVPILKYGLDYQKTGISKAKARKKKALWDTFVEKGANYPYHDNPEPLMIAEKLVPGFEIFVEVNETKEPIVEEPVVEELVHAEEPKEDIPIVELKNTVNQEKGVQLHIFVLNSILDVFMMKLIFLWKTCLTLMIFSFPK